MDDAARVGEEDTINNCPLDGRTGQSQPHWHPNAYTLNIDHVHEAFVSLNQINHF